MRSINAFNPTLKTATRKHEKDRSGEEELQGRLNGFEAVLVDP
jgi:hypothetical protein